MNFQIEKINEISFEFLTNKYLIFMQYRKAITPLEIILNKKKTSQYLKRIYSRCRHRNGKYIFFDEDNPSENYLAIKKFRLSDNDSKIFFSGDIQDLSSRIDIYCSEPVLYIPSYMAFYEFIKYALPSISAYSLCQHKSLKLLFFPHLKLSEDFLKEFNFDVMYYKPDCLYFFKKIYFYNSSINSRILSLINKNSFKLFQSLPVTQCSHNNTRLFLIRKNGHGNRNLTNKKEIINISRRFGFNVVSPEIDFSNFKEQASFFKNCEYFICEGGSGLGNFLLTPKMCKILVLQYNLKGIQTITKELGQIMKDTGHDLNYSEGKLISGNLSNCSWTLCPIQFKKSILSLLKKKKKKK